MYIDFYILEEASGQKSLLFACQLIEKAYAEKNKVYVHTASRDEANRFDAMLWTYRDDSFIPHLVCETDDALPPPVQIGWELPPPEQRDVLINLTRETPTFYSQFTRVIEIVFSDPHVQQLARERFKQYRDQGHNINTHKLKANET